MFLRMNYLFCLLVLGALSVSAEVYSQNGLVSLKMKDVSLVKVFNEITKQTGYDFLYNYDLVQNKGTVDVNAKMVDLKDFLHDLLKGKNLGFEFRDGAIIVRGESVRLDDQKIKSRTIKGIVRDTEKNKNGIFIGTNIYNDSLVFIDRYDTKKYKNANICIFGTSGAGKSFYTKLLILRYKLLGIKQYIIDPDREYNKICEKLDGVLIKIGPTSNTYINILEIRQESIEEGENGYLAIKISKLIGFFNLIFGEMDEEEKAILEEKIILTYKEKNITFDDKSLFNENNKFKNKMQMPILEDLYNILAQDEKTKRFKTKLIPFVHGSMKFFNNYTNIELNNELIVADIYDLGEENIKYGMYLFTDIFWDKIKENREEKKAIYLDEIWRLIGVTSNKNVASFIYKIFKTIRKYGGSGVAITQDISDIFSLENGTYGRSILNNSSIKTFFALEEENIKILEEYTNLSEKEKVEIKSLKRGECLMFVGDDHILTKIEASDLEKKIIEGENKIEKNNNSY